jgi:hypothetical protein
MLAVPKYDMTVHSSNEFGFHSGNTRNPGIGYPLLRFFIIFFNYYMQMPRLYLKIGHYPCPIPL